MDLSFKFLRRVTRRHLLRSGVTVGCAPFLISHLATAQEKGGASLVSGKALKITDLEFTEYTAHYDATAGVNGQYQVNPLDVYDELRRSPYQDVPGGTKSRVIKAIYLQVKTAEGVNGVYGPIERDVALTVLEELRTFVIGKDALAGETLWDQMYRSHRHSRAGLILMAISAVDNTLWDLRGRYYGVPVYRLLGGPTRPSVEAYASCLGFSLEPEAVKKRCLLVKDQGYRYQKWFLAYGPGSGPEGMRKNVEIVRILRETLGNDTELMFDTFSGWDLSSTLAIRPPGRVHR
jgi:L-rhamnonate dehydratase